MSMCARYRPREFVGAFEIDNGEIRVVQTPELGQILDHWIVDVRANYYILNGPCPSAKCVNVGGDHS